MRARMEAVLATAGFHLWVALAIILLGIASYAWGRWPMEMVSLAIIVALLLFFHIFPLPPDPGGGDPLTMRRLLSGFSDPALIAIICLLVMGQALVHAGALDEPVRRLLEVARGAPRLVMRGILAIVFAISGFLNNTPVVAVFIPILSALSRKLEINPSRLMIPLSYAAILGGNLTIIGSSANLLVAGVYMHITGERLGFFSITLPGLIIGLVGFAYVAFLAPRLLPDRVPLISGMSRVAKQFIIQFEVPKGGSLEGAKAVSGLFPQLTHLTVRAIHRGDATLLPPFDDLALQAGDIVIAAATREALTEMLAKDPGLVHLLWRRGGVAGEEIDSESPLPEDRMLAEVMIAPASRLQGRTLEQVGFRSLTNCIVLGIQRRSRMIRSHISELVLEPGDVLLLLGRREDVMALRGNRDLLLLEWSTADFPMVETGRLALGVFGATILLASTGALPITIAAMLGVLVMLAGRCINIRQAGRAVDGTVVLVIAAAIAMGETMQATGGAVVVADALLAALKGADHLLILSVFFLVVMLFTNLLSNNATAVLFTPIAVALAEHLGADPRPFAFAVIFASKAAFATPFGYQTNLLVMAPGHYRFTDFVRAGLPLAAIVWITFTLVAAALYVP
ncbi:MAG: sodium:sulfate symporter [Rhodothalassiaceae bacterium]|nr:MAG: sodium:sulfate symporter [Rhodothalassiaceae bacterium]